MKKIYLTGTGPGDLDLLTVKVFRIIREADILIYDRLANEEALFLQEKGVKYEISPGVSSAISVPTYDDTIVFLTGPKNIDTISQRLLSLGKPKDYPIAVISKGTTKEQKVVVGTLEDIAVKSKDLATPAPIVVGEVVKLQEKLQWFETHS